MQRLVRFARYWDLVANSGRFVNTIDQMLGDAPFDNFMAFSDWIYGKTDATHRIALDRLAALVAQWLQVRGMDKDAALALVGQRLRRPHRCAGRQAETGGERRRCARRAISRPEHARRTAVADAAKLFYTGAMPLENAPTLTLSHADSSTAQAVVASGVWQVHALADRGAIKAISDTARRAEGQGAGLGPVRRSSASTTSAPRCSGTPGASSARRELKLAPKAGRTVRAHRGSRQGATLPRTRRSRLTWVMVLGFGMLSFFEHLYGFIRLIGQVVQDIVPLRAPSAHRAVARDFGEHLPRRLPGARHHRAGRLPDRRGAVLSVGAAAAHLRRRHVPGEHPRHERDPRTRAAAGGDPGGGPLRLVDHRAAGRDAGHRGTRRDAGDGHLARLPADHAEGARAGDLDAAAGGVDRCDGADRRHGVGQDRS